MKVTGLFFAWSAAIFYLIATIYHFVAHEVVGVVAVEDERQPTLVIVVLVGVVHGCFSIA